MLLALLNDYLNDGMQLIACFTDKFQLDFNSTL